MLIRSATAADLEAMLTLAAIKRHEYAVYSPVFWRVADEVEAKQAQFFLDQRLHNADAITLVAEEHGVVVGVVQPLIHDTPPIYDPGGLVCSIDDCQDAPNEKAECRMKSQSDPTTCCLPAQCDSIAVRPMIEART